jgi:uncharacterized repeat protein (TIGR03803 family)
MQDCRNAGMRELIVIQARGPALARCSCTHSLVIRLAGVRALPLCREECRMKTFRTATGLVLFIIATSVNTSATSRFGVDVIHTFTGGQDGASSSAALVHATDGNFYGTSRSGGAFNAGTVFKITPSGAVTILHVFTGGDDGASPLAALIQASDGNLYGTTYLGGIAGKGTVFTMTPAGAFTPLHAFTGGAGTGAHPRAPLMQATDGNFYGTTELGGVFDRGTLFQMTPEGIVTLIYTFTGGLDGAYPWAPVIQAADGSFYGTAYSGDFSTFGRIFRMSPTGSVTVVHTFAGGSTDGANPVSALVQANDGNFYGTTLLGGASNAGTAFRLTAGGTVTVLNTFGGGYDGANPGAALVQAADGNFYGTTRAGASSYGTVFKMSPAGMFTLVHRFTGGADGALSSAGLIQATGGKLYGTTTSGGSSALGVVFRLPATAPADFDGDGKADMTVYRPSTGKWYMLSSGSNYTSSGVVSWGLSTDTPVPGDYDGDGKTDPAVFRPATGVWYILQSGTNYTTSRLFSWGLSTDVPVPADYDGDGKVDPAVYRPSTGQWFILTSGSNYTASIVVSWGVSTDVPLQGDYDGDGKADPAVYRPSTGVWFILKSSTGYTTSIVKAWGLSTDVPVPGDYDGDGRIDPAVYRPSTGQWFFLNSSTNYTSSGRVSWGISTDIPVRGDYDGDGKTDPAVFRPSTGNWFILKSSTGYTTSMAVSWGVSTDTPINRRP